MARRRPCVEERKLKGLCVVCGQTPALADSFKCQNCKEEAAATSKSARKKRRDAGLCVDCGEEKHEEGKTRCGGCAEKSRDKERHIREALRIAGICVICRERPSRSGVSRCDCCASKASELYVARRNENRCRCGRPSCGPPDGTVFCRECYFKNTAASVLKDRKRAKDIEELFESQEGRCPVSGRKLILGVNTSLDHIEPQSLGGTHEIENLRWVVQQVNTMKWNYRDEEFLAMVRDIYELNFGSKGIS